MDIRNTNRLIPPPGIVAKAMGRARAIIAFEPATRVPKKNMSPNITTGGTAIAEKYSGSLSMTPVTVNSSLNTIITTVVRISFVSNAV